MDSTTPIILKCYSDQYMIVTIEASNGKKYSTDLSLFRNVVCFPKDEASWFKFHIDSYGLVLVWTSRFEVHIDQIIALAFQVESTPPSAA